ncbi:ATP-binding protein [Nocardiopsis ansamitocini]|uniref:Histidine kinase/HSP90-like ATPase domain-containing protein n=1 Tax=Nocardiopsis ansamitocini TaxID=1670832 RepID=A0A9W6UG72_9ACTN|nr:ATP-binding protein [Nocardiopsis ansamitocini]GLU46711.1 hypothetical protein Nans01_10620 [Nocardiopsis ansamitocini]
MITFSPEALDGLDGHSAVREFPGTEENVSRIRGFVDQALGQSPGTPLSADLIDTALLLVSEVAANAIQHTLSGEPGGFLKVRVYRGADTVTIHVHDQGGRHAAQCPTVRELDPDTEFGRGMALVQTLATCWGTGPSRSFGRQVWFEMTIA